MKLRFDDKNFDDEVDYDFDIERDCEAEGCDEICRCSRYTNFTLDPCFNEITEKLYEIVSKNYEDTKEDSGKVFEQYIIDRIARVHKLWDGDNFEVELWNGLYGDEVGGISLETNTFKELENVFDLNDNSKRIEYILKLEYGYLLPELEGKTYKVETIKKEDIIFGSVGHYKKLDGSNLDHYSDNKYNGIRGLVIPVGDKYRLIDGYHRCFKTEKDEVEVLVAH